VKKLEIMISLAIKEIIKCRTAEICQVPLSIIHVAGHLKTVIFTITVLVNKDQKMQEARRNQEQRDSKISLKTHQMRNLPVYHVALKVD